MNKPAGLSLEEHNLVGNVQMIIFGRQVNISLLLSIRSEQAVGLGHISVVELPHSLLSLLLVGFDTHNGHKCAVVFCLRQGSLGGQGDTMMAEW